MRSTIHDQYDPCDPCDPYDPYDPLTAASFPKAEGLLKTAFNTISHSYQIVISGKIQYFRTFSLEAYSLKEFCHFRMHA